MRSRFTKAQKLALEQWSEEVLTPESFCKEQSSFENSQELVIDIGFGMGDILVAEAIKNPNINYVGIEIFLQGIGSLLYQIKKLNVENIKIIQAQAEQAIKLFFKKHTVSQINIFYPDPWPKKRHFKRRLIQTEFLKHCYPKLIECGEIRIITDWQDYADYIEEVLQKLINYYSYTLQISNECVIESKFAKRGQKLHHKHFQFTLKKSNN